MITIECPDATFTDIRAIFFDKDGTLVQVQPYLRLLSETVLEQIERQIPGLTQPLSSCWGLTATGLDPNGLMAVASRRVCELAAIDCLIAQGILRSQAQALVENAYGTTEQLLPRKAPLTPLIPGILDFLADLQQRPVKLGILTSDSPENLMDCLRFYSLEPMLALALGSESGQLSKPDPAFYQQACDRLGCPSAQTLIIGDAEADCRMAKSTGAGAIGVTWAWPEISPQFLSADTVVSQIKDIKILTI